RPSHGWRTGARRARVPPAPWRARARGPRRPRQRVGEARRITRLHEEPGLPVADELRIALEVGADDGRADGERLAQRPGEAEPGVRGVHRHVARLEDLGNVLSVEEDAHAVADLPRGRLVVEDLRLRLVGADEEE